MKQLTLEEFAWRCLWLECGRLATQDCQCGTVYLLKQVRALKRRTVEGKLWAGPYGAKSEWAGMVRNWYANYLKTGDL